MAFCLPKEFADKLEAGFKSGKITPEALRDLTPEARRAELKKYVGEENVRQVNADFESKLVLKNVQAGLERWVESSTAPKKAKAEMIEKVQKMDRVLSEAEMKIFLEDMVSKKLGLTMTEAEFKMVSELANEAQTARAKIDNRYLEIDNNKDMRAYQKANPEILEYGTTRVLLDKYMELLKFGENKGKPIPEQVKTYLTDPKLFRRLIIDVGGITKTLVATLDLSFFGRQGLVTLVTNPTIWGRAFKQNLGTVKAEIMGRKWIREQFKKEVKGYEDVINLLDFNATDIIRADVYGRPNALNGLYDRMKLDVGIGFEEALPSSVPSQIPGVGRLFASSESSFTGGAMRMRADLADRYARIAKTNKVDLKDAAEAESIGKLVNAMTGRGDIGRLNVFAQETNVAFFSVKWFKSNVDVLTAHQLQKGVTPFVRKQAALNLAKVITATASTLVLAEALWPGSVEKDARSADFGKIQIGSTRFDVSGGKSSIITLAMRLARGSTKSASTDKIYELNTGAFGSKTRWDVVTDFAENKAAPLAGAGRDFLRGYDFGGDKPTVTSTLKGLMTPISIQTSKELLDDPNSANFIMSMILEELGISANTF